MKPLVWYLEPRYLAEKAARDSRTVVMPMRSGDLEPLSFSDAQQAAKILQDAELSDYAQKELKHAESTLAAAVMNLLRLGVTPANIMSLVQGAVE
jgi:flagellar basal body P-ring protein FlgI